MERIYYFIILFFSIAFQSIPTFAQFKAPRILKHPSQIKVERLNMLNSIYRETNLNISPDGSYLFFMSGRGLQPWSDPGYTTYKGKPEHDGDIWYARKVNGRWQYPKCLGPNVNTRMGEDEPNISPDGQTVYFQSWRSIWKITGGPYYKSTLSGTSWGKPRGLGGGITRFFSDLDSKPPLGQLGTDGATMSADGKTFIVAAGKDYQGNMDLYISRKTSGGYWSYPQRLSVSTLGNERAPFLAADGKTLYFASDGYGGWGGLDILKTVIDENNKHEEVVNVGTPFNTWLDDYGLLLTASGDDAYFVREGDIYYANTTNASPELKPFSATLLVKGKITDAKTHKGLHVEILIKSQQTQKIIARIKSNSVTGNYAMVIPTSENKFVVEVIQKNYEKFTQRYQKEIKSGLNEVIANVPLEPTKKEVAVVKNNEEPKEAAADTGKQEYILK